MTPDEVQTVWKETRKILRQLAKHFQSMHAKLSAAGISHEALGQDTNGALEVSLCISCGASPVASEFLSMTSMLRRTRRHCSLRVRGRVLTTVSHPALSSLAGLK